MVKARIAPNTQLLLVFDGPSPANQAFLKHFVYSGIPLDSISAVCLHDVDGKPKASDYKNKAEYINELISVYGFNLVVPVGASAFDRVVGFKGASKYFGKIVRSESYGCKCLPCANPAQAKYDPKVATLIKETIELIKVEMNFPEIHEQSKIPTDYKIIDTMEKFQEFYKHFISSKVKEFAFDLETTGLAFNVDDILTIQFSDVVGSSYLIPANYYKLWSKEDWLTIVCSLRRLFADESKTLIFHNGKFDLKFIQHHWGIKARKKNTFDTMIASFLCDENTPNGLKDLASELTDLGNYEFELDRFKDDYCKRNKMKKSDFSYAFIPFEILAPYALCDTDVTIRIYHQFKELLKVEEQEKTFEMVMRFSYLLTKMEINGWPVDIPWATKYSKILEDASTKLNAELQENPLVIKASNLLKARALDAANEKRVNKITELKTAFEFKFNSTPMKHCLFFEVMRLGIVAHTKTKNAQGKFNPSCGKEAVDKWIEIYPEHEDFLVAIRTLGMLNKIKSTYVDAIINKHVNGRIHPTYNVCGTKTGRLSSNNPNLQNIMTRADKKVTALLGFDPAKYVKKIFAAKDGNVIIGADLSAAEMRGACLISGDRKLIEIFCSGVDVHCAIAKELFPYIPEDMPDDEIKVQFAHERTIAKTVQFLSLYGGGADKLAKTAKITVERAQEILDDYFKKYAGVDQFIKDTTAFVIANGYSLSPHGRKRRVPEVNSTDEFARARAIRQAVNAVIQSFASDELLNSACDLLDDIEENNLPITILGPVHDALYQEVAEEYRYEARDALLFHMQKFSIPSPIPMVADAEFGRTWADFEGFAEVTPDNYDDDTEDDELEAA